MALEGKMVRGDGRLMKVVQTFHQFARCRWVDPHGYIRSKWFERDRLVSLEAAIRPRSLWPDPGQLELIEIEREERTARAAQVLAKAAKRKVRRSKRIKRSAA